MEVSRSVASSAVINQIHAELPFSLFLIRARELHEAIHLVLRSINAFQLIY